MAETRRRVLFVDDEPQVLDGLRRMMRRERGRFQTSFAARGLEALDMMAADEPDILVTDIRMPSMDGIELLHRVQSRHPRVVRVALTGSTELAASIQTIAVAHQFLGKPCEPDTLRDVLDRAVVVQDLLESPCLRTLVGEVDALPSRPEVFSELTAALSDPDTCLPDLARIVEKDTAMCAKILHVVNSAYFGLSRSVRSIQHAVGLLGTGTLRALVLSEEVFRTYEGVGELVDLDALHRGAMAAGVTAKRIATTRQMSDDAFLACLLMDVGILILASELGEDYATLVRQAERESAPLYQVERRALGIDHGRVGAYLLGLWGLPHPIVEAVAWHHTPGDLDRTVFDGLGVVHVAGALLQTAPWSGDLDESWLERCDVDQHLARWQELASVEAHDRGPDNR